MNDVYSIECTNFPYELNENQIFFVEREYEWYINQYIGRNRKRFEKAFSSFNYEFCYLPQSQNIDVAYTIRQVLSASREVNCALCKFGYMDGNKAVFYCVELDNDEKEESLAKQFYHFACWCKVEPERRQRWIELDKLAEEEQILLYGSTFAHQTRPKVQIMHNVDEYECLEEYFDNIEECQEYKDVSYADIQLTELRNIVKELREMGVAEERILEAVDSKPELSRLEITNDYRILLPDFKKEVQLPPIHKALFILFLRHPNGIGLKELSDYKQELTDIYMELTDRIDAGVIQKTISGLCDPINNSVHEKCSIIRRAFSKVVGDKLAGSYCITGKKGESKRISLPKELVIMPQTC